MNMFGAHGQSRLQLPDQATRSWTRSFLEFPLRERRKPESNGRGTLERPVIWVTSVEASGPPPPPPPTHPWHSNPLASKMLLPFRVRNLEWEPLRPSGKTAVIGCRWQETRRSRKSDRTRTMSAASTVTWKRPPSIRIQPHPATSQHLVIRNCIGIKWIWDLFFLPPKHFSADKSILYIFTLTRSIFQEAIQLRLCTETRSAQHQWLHPDPRQPAQEHRWCLGSWKDGSPVDNFNR